jgi:hypothetical protein
MDDAKSCWQQWFGDWSLWGKLGRRPSISLVEGAQPFVATNVPSPTLCQDRSSVFEDGFVHPAEPDSRLTEGEINSGDGVDVVGDESDCKKIVTEQPGMAMGSGANSFFSP